MNKSRKTILIVVLLLILGGLAVGGYFYYKNFEKNKKILAERKKVSEEIIIGTIKDIQNDKMVLDIKIIDQSIETKEIKLTDGTIIVQLSNSKDTRPVTKTKDALAIGKMVIINLTGSRNENELVAKRISFYPEL